MTLCASVGQLLRRYRIRGTAAAIDGVLLGRLAGLPLLFQVPRPRLDGRKAIGILGPVQEWLQRQLRIAHQRNRPRLPAVLVLVGRRPIDPAANRKHGLMRQSVKTCVWLGSPDCYRNQEAVLWEESEKHSTRKWSDRALQNRPSGYTVREGRTAQTSAMRGGTVPFNLLPIPSANTDDTGGHPASTPYDLAACWCRYTLPPKGVLLDMYCGSGTMLAAGLEHGASKVIGIEKERKFLKVAKKRVG